MASHKRKQRHVQRTFPKFHEGMSTADYVRQYWGANARNIGIECRSNDDFKQASRAIADFFAPLNCRPASMLDGPGVTIETI